jgi:uroporphyrinogen-III synthase
VSQRWRAPLVIGTGDAQPDDPFASLLRASGATVLAMPMIAYASPADPRPLAHAIERLATMRWVVFTSAQAVTATCGQPRWTATWQSIPTTRPRIAAIGPATERRLRAVGLAPDLVPDRSSGRDLAAALLDREGSLRGVRVLWPRSEIATRELPDALVAAGAVVTEPDAYRTLPVVPAAFGDFVERLESGQVDAVAFFSPSAARSLSRALGDGTLRRLAGRTEVASIGPTTSATLADLAAPATIEGEPHTGAGLARAILKRLTPRRGAA